MKHLIKLYNTWREVKDVFLKPSLWVYFGKWRNDPNLPYWRHGPQIYLTKRRKLSSKAYRVSSTVMICTGTKREKFGKTEHDVKCYSWVPRHKLPDNLKEGQYIWNRDIRKKLKKWHLSWVKPVIQLPIWMRFYILNMDVCWKTKFDDIRYEFPPQFTIVAFGLSLTFTLHSPIQNDLLYDDHYWEAMLNFVHKNHSHTIREAIESAGIWSRFSEDMSKRIYFFAFRPEFLQKRWLPGYYIATHDLRVKENKEIL